MLKLMASLTDCIRQADRPGAGALLDAWAVEHGYGRLLTDVLEPLLQRIGEDWSTRESFTLAQIYVAAKVAEDLLAKIATHVTPEAGSAVPGRPVVIGNIEEDFHALGRRMVGTFLRAEGWVVHDLGNDVSPEAFIERAVATGARVVGASAMISTSARNIRRLRDEIDRRHLTGRVQLAVGGAIFVVHPELVREVGGDGTAVNAIGASRLFATLWARSEHQEESP